MREANLFSLLWSTFAWLWLALFWALKVQLWPELGLIMIQSARAFKFKSSVNQTNARKHSSRLKSSDYSLVGCFSPDSKQNEYSPTLIANWLSNQPKGNQSEQHEQQHLSSLCKRAHFKFNFSSTTSCSGSSPVNVLFHRASSKSSHLTHNAWFVHLPKLIVVGQGSSWLLVVAVAVSVAISDW